MRTVACSSILIGSGPINGHVIDPIFLKYWAILFKRRFHYVRIPDQDLIEYMAKYSQLY